MKEVLEALAIKPGGLYVDATFGGGGHTRAILETDPTVRVISLDVDKNALDINGPAIKEAFGDRWDGVWGNFARIHELVKKSIFAKEFIDTKASVDGILADFGTSQFQIKERAGFSFALDTPLDMRMSAAHGKTTAADIVNYASESELAKIFFEYGEERYSRKIAQAICTQRAIKKFKTTADLVKVILVVVPRSKHESIHPATRVFQALRIVVNKELESITAFLKNAVPLLKTGGRLACISFHSLEDRLVKQFIREHSAELENLTPRVIIPTDDETAENPSARSSKLRVASKR